MENNYGKIFISHRALDKEVVDILFEFLIAVGIPRESIFCSSLPGNDVKEKISDEVKRAIDESVINIVLLSKDYYDSAYCLNEAGIIWYKDIKVIVIALPEITPDNMYGFLDSNYKIRRLNNDTDVSYIYEEIRETINIPQVKIDVFTVEFKKLLKKYEEFLNNREDCIAEDNSQIEKEITIDDLVTDDERIVMYYILSKKVRIIKKDDLKNWLQDIEIYDVNIENAFDLLSNLGKGNYNNERLEIDIDVFRKYSANCDDYISDLQAVVHKHQIVSAIEFERMWNLEKFDDVDKLFIAYIINENVISFGTRWKEKIQIEHIKRWEENNYLQSILSKKYDKSLNLFINKRFVYESSWTDYGNPREYTLCNSLKDYLFSSEFSHIDELNRIVDKYEEDLPF